MDSRSTALKDMLDSRRRALQGSLDTKLAEVRIGRGPGGPVEPVDDAEASESLLQQDIRVSLTEMTAQALRRVEEALARVEIGVYGVCVDCEADIPQARLVAVPFAPRCRECEELREADERAIALLRRGVRDPGNGCRREADPDPVAAGHRD